MILNDGKNNTKIQYTLNDKQQKEYDEWGYLILKPFMINMEC